MDIGTVALRGVVGPLFVGHGTQKLFGWFGGHGLDGTGGFFESIGLRPGRRHAMAAGIAEAGGGALLTLGALTPLAATMVAGTMVTAIRKVHLPNGPWVTENGYEYNAVVIAAMATLVQHGPGQPSVDAALFPGLKGKGWAVASLAAAVGGSFLLDKLAEAAPTEASAGDTNAGTGTPQAMTDAADTATSTATSTT
jgi:putative oxidoreductase